MNGLRGVRTAPAPRAAGPEARGVLGLSALSRPRRSLSRPPPPASSASRPEKGLALRPDGTERSREVPSPGPARGLPACVQGLTGAGGVGQTSLPRGLRQRGPWSPAAIHFPVRAALLGRLQFSAEPGHSRGRLGSCGAGRDREGRILNQRETE